MRSLPRPLGLLLGCLLLATPIHARPVHDLPLPEQPANEADSIPVRGGTILAAQDDTTWYGGTVWAADSLRWEALRDGRWSFDTGIGSSINAGALAGKPVGYHATMEGWTGLDLTAPANGRFERSTTCAIAGSWSLWAGADPAMAESLCYVAGQGYGNGWHLGRRKSFAYPGSGGVTLHLDYAVDAEPGFDDATLLIDTTGVGAADPVELTSWTGPVSGTWSATLLPGTTLRRTPGPVALILRADADGAYSDEDGLYLTTCGLAAFDNIVLSGAIVDESTFEAGLDGWALDLGPGVGDFSNLAWLGDLPAPVAFCPCGLRDSVLVFFDQTGHHPLDQENLALSPWIDLKAGGDVNRPGKVMSYDVYAEMPLANYIFVLLKARWYPDLCPVTGKFRLSPFRDQNTVFYYGEAPFCNPTNAWRTREYSDVIPAGAEQVQVAVGMINLCRTAPFGVACTGVTNTTPWIDNFALGIHGVASAPNIRTTTIDRFQDNFAADGTMNPGSPGHVDVNRIKGNSVPSPGTSLGDTLVARGDGGNSEVRLIFRVQPGPFTNPSALATRAALWTPEPGLQARYGGAWYSARMDTAEQGGVLSAGQWMSTFHESDPGFRDTDRTAEPTNGNQLANDIIPDNLFTPGSRIDYFVASRYQPPDPRNPAGGSWFTDPDTAGGAFREIEILPSSMAPDSSWNCTLYVDHHDDRAIGEQRIEEAALAAVIGPGGHNVEGTRYDRFDNQAPSSNQLSFGRPVETGYGCSGLLVFCYSVISWQSSTLSSGQLTREDVNLLLQWLNSTSGLYEKRFWGAGGGLATSMHNGGSGSTTRTFLNNTLGVLRTCDTIRMAGCPTGSAIDTTYCLPTVAESGSHFPSTLPPRIIGNGCPELGSNDVLAVNPAVSTARSQLAYLKDGATVHSASISNEVTGMRSFLAVLDGMPLGQLRATDPGPPAVCGDDSGALARAADILGWFQPASACKKKYWGGLDSDDSNGRPPDPAYRLGPATPNPAHESTTIFFQSAGPAERIVLRLFDVAGRPVRTLSDGAWPAGPQQITWDGRADDGRPVASGLYWYRMEAGPYRAAGKVIVQR